MLMVSVRTSSMVLPPHDVFLSRRNRSNQRHEHPRTTFFIIFIYACMQSRGGGYLPCLNASGTNKSFHACPGFLCRISAPHCNVRFFLHGDRVCFTAVSFFSNPSQARFRT